MGCERIFRRIIFNFGTKACYSLQPPPRRTLTLTEKMSESAHEAAKKRTRREEEERTQQSSTERMRRAEMQFSISKDISLRKGVCAHVPSNYVYVGTYF